MVRNQFNCEPTWQIVLLPVILLVMLLVGIFTGLKLKRLYNPLAPDPIQFPVPVCDEHRGRLGWHRYFLWALIALLVAATAVLLPLSISIAAARGQDVSGREQIMQGALIVSLVLGALLLLASMVIKLFTPRVVHYTSTYVDMASLAPEFVEAVRRTSTSSVPGYGGQSMGVPLSAGMHGAKPSMKSIVIVGGGTLALVGSCCLVTMILPALMRWNSKQAHARIRAQMAEHLKQREANQQQQPTKLPPSDSVAKTSRSSLPPSPSSLPPPPSSLPPPSPAAPALSPALPKRIQEKPSSAVPITGADAAPTEVNPGKRLDEFKTFSMRKFPPNSREIRDQSELSPGMEVWAYRGPTWYRAKVLRAEGKLTRIKFSQAGGPSEFPLPASLIRIPTD